MSAPAGVTPAPSIRRTTSAEAEGQTERLIRLAHDLLSLWGIGMSHNRVVKHVRRFEREVFGFTFFDYLANAVQVDDQHRDDSRTILDAYLRATFELDPVGVTAVRHVARERGQR